MECPILEHGMQEIKYMVLIGASNRPREVFCKMICCSLSGNFLGYAVLFLFMILFYSRLVSGLQSDSRNRRSLSFFSFQVMDLCVVCKKVEDLVLIGLRNRVRGGVL